MHGQTQILFMYFMHCKIRYLFNTVGFPPGGSGPYTVHKSRTIRSIHKEKQYRSHNNVQKIKRWKSMSKRPIGRPKTHWEDDALEDINSMNVRN